MITVECSQNRKTGIGVANSYRGKQSCTPNCPMKKACYAKRGYTNLSFNRATNDKKDDAEQISEFITKLPPKTLVRMHVSGDFFNKGKVDRKYINALVSSLKKRSDVVSWSYTHGFKRMKNFSKGLKNFTLSASCQNIKEVKWAKKKGWDTVLIVPKDFKTNQYIEKERIIVCPSQLNSKTTCSLCQLCIKKNRKYVIAFKIH